MPRHRTSRRDFLRTNVGIAAAAAIPYTWTSSTLHAQDQNDRPVLGCIGVGGMGTGDGLSASRFADVVACADVDETRPQRFVDRVKEKERQGGVQDIRGLPRVARSRRH